MKKVFLLVSLAVVLGLVLVGCPQPNDGSETPVPARQIVMVDIPQGTYDYQGSEDTTVQAFTLAETEVTQAQWVAVMTEWPGKDEETYKDTGVYKVPSYQYGLGDDKPAYYISWYDAVEFCNALTRAELTEDDVVYTITKGNETNQDTWTVGVDVTKNGYRLPTEKEWEYAAGWEKNGERNSHAGVNIETDVLDPNDLDNDGNTNEADDIDDNDPTKDLREYAWYYKNSENTTHIVGTAGSDTLDIAKSGNDNALGLYDMSGNVWEWCYGVDSGSGHRLRGGSWDDNSSLARVTMRYSNTLNTRSMRVGFRVARNAN